MRTETFTDFPVEEYLRRLPPPVDSVALVPAREMIFRPEYRRFCEENLCGEYGKCWACPPACGTPSEMAARAGAFSHCLLLIGRDTVRDAMNPLETIPIQRRRNAAARAYLSAMKKALSIGSSLTMTAGPCGLCEVCALRENQPCRHPGERTSCVSAYGVDMGALMASAGEELSWRMDEICSVVVFLW